MFAIVCNIEAECVVQKNIFVPIEISQESLTEANVNTSSTLSPTPRSLLKLAITGTAVRATPLLTLILFSARYALEVLL